MFYAFDYLINKKIELKNTILASKTDMIIVAEGLF